MKIKNLLTLMLLIQSPILLQAEHILGGQMSYQHIAGTTYSIELTIYRDCSGDGALFDDPAVIAVYAGFSEPYNFINQYGSSPESVEVITANQESCYAETSNFCTEIGIYTYEITFPNTTDDYHVVYQRCCRSSLFSNVENLEETGFTITIEINTEALENQNNSPELNDNPLFEVCNNVPFEIDFSATDDNADSLIYELCHPISGGGPFGTPSFPGDPSACNGVQPLPACPPPFDSITFFTPYSFNDPLGVASEFSIDRYTGMISGNAMQIGQFLAGVCITEYKDGEVISFSQQELVFRVDFPTNIEEHKVKQLSLFPNPATHQLLIELPSDHSIYELIIRDLNGKMVHHKQNISGTQMEINTSKLSGVYMIELKNENSIYVERVLVINN